jgi:hypothetical protein
MMADAPISRPELLTAHAAATAIRNQLDSEQAALRARLEIIEDERKRADAILEHIDGQLTEKKKPAQRQAGKRAASGRKRAS